MEGIDEHDIETEWQPRQVCSNPSLRNEIGVLSDNGQVYIWDIQSENVSILFKRKVTESKNTWAGVEFGSHPRSLLLGTNTEIQHLDMRSKTSSVIKSVSSSYLFNSMKRNPKNSFQVAISTKSATSIYDTRFTKTPMLEWNVNNFFEHQFHLEYLDIPTGMNEFASDCVYNWGRHYGETLLYCYQQQNELPIQSTHIQKLKPFYDHIFYTKRLENIHPPTVIEDLTFRAMAQQRIDNPPWPALIGCKLIPNSKTGKDLTFLQYTSEGSLFAQSYRFQNEDATPPELLQDLELDLHTIEADVYSKIKELATDGFEENEEADHDEIDFTPIWNLCEQKASRSDWKRLERDGTPEPDTTTISSL
jgi:hypothetical protein